MKPEVDVKTFGPIFSGAIYGQMKKALERIDDELGDRVVEEIQLIDDRTFKNPTGHARSKVRAVRQRGTVTVDRSKLIYGPWLEDGGSRSSIFPGYHAFEKAKKKVDEEAMDIAEPIVQDYVIEP